MKLRINFHISEKTTLEPSIIILNIQRVLTFKRYDTINVTSSSVLFKINPWRLQMRGGPTRIDGGVFQLIGNGDFTSVSLNYYFDCLTPLLIYSTLIIILAAERQYEPMAFFSAIFIFSSIVSIVTFRIKANEMIRAILTTDTI